MKDFLQRILIVGLCLGAAFLGGFLLRDAQWQAKHDDYIKEQARAAEDTQRRLDDDLAAIGIKHEQEREHEQKIIDDLRGDLATGRLRLRQAEAICAANAHKGEQPGNEQGAEPNDGERGLGEDILRLAEIAKTAIGQRNELQESIDKFNEGVE